MGAFSYTIDYSKMDPKEAKKKALKDIDNYRGRGWRTKIKKSFLAEFKTPPTKEHFCNLISLGGIQGFPAVAFYEWIYPPKK